MLETSCIIAIASAFSEECLTFNSITIEDVLKEASMLNGSKKVC